MKIDKEIIETNFPFMAVMEMNDKEYMGIILNSDKSSVTFIDFSKIPNTAEVKRLVNIGMNWWWYSNRSIPLNLFYYEDVLPYMEYVSSLPAKNTEVICGHVCSLEKLINRKYYRKNKVLTIIEPHQ